MIGNVKKFSLSEMTSNNDGKTSATSASGVYIIFIGGLCFILGVINKMFFDKSIDIIDQSVLFTTLGAALLGVKNVVASKYSVTESTSAPAQPETEIKCETCGKTPCECSEVLS